MHRGLDALHCSSPFVDERRRHSIAEFVEVLADSGEFATPLGRIHGQQFIEWPGRPGASSMPPISRSSASGSNPLCV